MRRVIIPVLLMLSASAVNAQNIASVQIEGEKVMTSGKDHDTAFANKYTLVAKDTKGNVIDAASIKGDFKVEWDIDGFKTENDTQGQYCDSYGAFSVNGKNALSTTFDLRNTPMNFIGNMTATLTIGKKKYVANKYVASLSMPSESMSSDATADDAQRVEIKAESGKVYDVKVAYTGVLMASYLNEDLSGYELGSQEKADTVTYSVPGIDGKIDLFAISGNGATPHISYISVTAQDAKQARKKRKVHHIGDSTSANKGSWAYHLLELINEGKFKELTALCEMCNDGAGGRNLSTYYKQSRLARVLCDICPGDIVMIGNNGTNGMNKTFEEDLRHYINAAEQFGAKIILNSYSPHGAVSRWEKGYNKETQTFDSYRRDQYDVVTRKLADELSKSDPHYIGFVEIGMNADKIFNAYVDDFKKNGHESRDAAAQAIISCFADHNHYNKGTLACELMLNGYKGIPGIVSQLVKLQSKK